MKKTFILTCLTLLAAVTSFGQSAISGTFGTCVGDSSFYIYVDSATSSGGTWSSSDPAIASVASTFASFEATVYGVSAGIATITYTLGSGHSTATFTVTPVPTAISGPATVCTGATITLSDATGGGTWSTDGGWGGYITIGTTTGVVTGVSAGYADVYYNVGPGCSAYTSITVSATDVGYITTPYPFTMCTGSSITLTESVTGGTWSSSSAAIATIDASTGVATGVSAGTVNFSYTVSGICGLASASDTITVLSTTPTATLSGPSSVYAGDYIDLSASIYGGTWSSSNTAVATVSSSGVVTGVTAGTTTIGYSVSGCSGVVTSTTNVTVTPFDGISGYVNFGSGGYYGTVRVWLITYNPTTFDLEAIDSTTLSIGGGSTSVYYQFPGIPTDSFRVKATVSFDTSYSPAGYIPTYHTSSYYWYGADVINHVSGTADINEDINMIAGTSSAGPGFIGGNVMSGANRGTSTGAPVPNLLIFAVNATTGSLVQQTYTDAGGNYTFTGLPLGTYLVHPELINYTTIPYTGITLTSGSSSVSSASFIEHTVSMLISPGSEGVKNAQPSVSSIAAYPNPANDKLNLAWNTVTTETGNVSLADVTGREVYKTTVNMKGGAGSCLLSLPGLASGFYILSIKSASINYSNKIQIQH